MHASLCRCVRLPGIVAGRAEDLSDIPTHPATQSSLDRVGLGVSHARSLSFHRTADNEASSGEPSTPVLSSGVADAPAANGGVTEGSAPRFGVDVAEGVADLEVFRPSGPEPLLSGSDECWRFSYVAG